jgi:hypothetical protein
MSDPVITSHKASGNIEGTVTLSLDQMEGRNYQYARVTWGFEKSDVRPKDVRVRLYRGQEHLADFTVSDRTGTWDTATKSEEKGTSWSETLKAEIEVVPWSNRWTAVASVTGMS